MEWPDSCPRRKLPASRQVAVIQKKQYALDAGTCARYAFHVGFLHKFCNAAQGGAPGLPRDDSLLYDLLRKGAQLPALGLDVLCGKDGAYQRHTVHAGALELQDVLLVDAANGYHRHIHGVADVQ